ncbi:EamA family transporter [Flavobacterium sp. NRK F7]|uniref:EamA family transporter n=1 Tax=Flavobacterium sp. NRK F7 TaxID=2954930 RepID=UPI002091D23A|nr:EamA family transporter [Flavobacterium sp. NRK F7]MCO6162733.1 EamA family transporter [Flavobacterium sp. NRK F7]
MISLFWAIFFSVLLFIVFKYFSKYNINTFQAIVCNYIVAFLVGIYTTEQPFSITTTLQKPWLVYCIYLGSLFIAIFFTMGKTSQLNGVSVASVASKMSLIIPVLFGLLFFKESIGFLKAIGIGIALFAVYFTTKKNTTTIENSNFTFPILLFFGSGIIDTSIHFIQKTKVPTEDTSLFSSFTFLSAFLVGCLVFTYQHYKNQFEFQFKNLIGGIALGIPNYFSMYFLIRALQNEKIQSATLFTLINIGVILLTTLIGLLLFKEKLKKQNYVGIALAILALVLVSF